MTADCRSNSSAIPASRWINASRKKWRRTGKAVVDRVNFARGRIYPSFLVNASAGAEIYKSDKFSMKLQADGHNLTNVVNVIDFGGLFSGNAIGPSRSFSLRLQTVF